MPPSLATFLASQQHEPTVARLAPALQHIAGACIAIASAIRQAALTGSQGLAGSDNIQGEAQQKLDVISNELMIEAARRCPQIAALASEELDDIVQLNTSGADSLLLLTDPLDGSSNLDIGMTVGSIFSLLPATAGPVTTASFLRPGHEQCCAGYALYGPATMLVFTTGSEVNGFTLDEARGEFLLTHPQLQIAPECSEFAINAANLRHWELPVQRYIAECQAGSAGPRGKDFNMRWVAAMVADVHRILLRGGVFLYPRDARQPPGAGKLRLLYEANPMALLIEAAGGAASNGSERLLDMNPERLHQRTGVVLGARNEVERLASYHLSH